MKRETIEKKKTVHAQKEREIIFFPIQLRES